MHNRYVCPVRRRTSYGIRSRTRQPLFEAGSSSSAFRSRRVGQRVMRVWTLEGREPDRDISVITRRVGSFRVTGLYATMHTFRPDIRRSAWSCGHRRCVLLAGRHRRQADCAATLGSSSTSRHRGRLRQGSDIDIHAREIIRILTQIEGSSPHSTARVSVTKASNATRSLRLTKRITASSHDSHQPQECLLAAAAGERA